MMDRMKKCSGEFLSGLSRTSFVLGLHVRGKLTMNDLAPSADEERTRRRAVRAG